MKLYPWLIKPYNNIITQYKINKAHHAILIKIQRGMGVSLLIWFISRWLLCLKPIGMNFCNQCHGCKLMSVKNHPDWHSLISQKNDIFNVNNIRIINEKIFQSSQQGGNKVIYISDIEKLTESAISAFLKTLEEPPKKTWFFLISYTNINLYSTLSSRCLIYKILPPIEQDSLNWLKKNTIKENRSYLTALRINQGSPISAKNFINGDIWIDRINFYKNLYDAFKNENLLKILKILNEKNTIVKIDWIYFLLIDCIRFNLNNMNHVINCDQIKLIKIISNKYHNIVLDLSIRTWMRCRYRLLNISGINYELILLEQLLMWEKILNFSFTI
ncbi:DNA polymerase III subunit delta' C-terminal domain-containing protein [Buchnera aphidicola]|uniref:DNA polymerase III subunit delta' n=1 Tax=Buchnera aphidicola (Artemisaphis artemisicola) TaxID=1241836 RepID=A0A4D6XL86_9GAMM|nr:DNA polymerase III subunit delta' C-terminal domain-containing protein [Buchnera aphidicola]QCI16024.1 DNA polymerase III subunit delta' [Buchnera aphidicola (Artemisaphis artemisicola)]